MVGHTGNRLSRFLFGKWESKWFLWEKVLQRRYKSCSFQNDISVQREKTKPAWTAGKETWKRAIGYGTWRFLPSCRRSELATSGFQMKGAVSGDRNWTGTPTLPYRLRPKGRKSETHCWTLLSPEAKWFTPFRRFSWQEGPPYFWIFKEGRLVWQLRGMIQILCSDRLDHKECPPLIQFLPKLWAKKKNWFELEI